MNNLRILPILCLLIWTGSVNCQNSGTFVDSRDSRTYKWVQMGEQIWMGENLKFQADSGAVCYDNNLLNCEYYGVLNMRQLSKFVQMAGTYHQTRNG